MKTRRKLTLRNTIQSLKSLAGSTTNNPRVKVANKKTKVSVYASGLKIQLR